MTASKKGGARPGAGRKPRVEGRVTRNAVTVRFTDDELRELKRIAGDTPASTYLRDLFLRHLARRTK